MHQEEQNLIIPEDQQNASAQNQENQRLTGNTEQEQQKQYKTFLRKTMLLICGQCIFVLSFCFFFIVGIQLELNLDFNLEELFFYILLPYGINYQICKNLYKYPQYEFESELEGYISYITFNLCLAQFMTYLCSFSNKIIFFIMISVTIQAFLITFIIALFNLKDSKNKLNYILIIFSQILLTVCYDQMTESTKLQTTIIGLICILEGVFMNVYIYEVQNITKLKNEQFKQASLFYFVTNFLSTMAITAMVVYIIVLNYLDQNHFKIK